MAPAPWDNVPLSDLLVVLVTGANSGIGLGINQKLIDDFLATRPSTSHLLLIPTTRSPSKSRETITSLQTHLRLAATTFAAQSPSSPAASSAAIIDAVIARVHILSIQLDLCSLPHIYNAAKQLCTGLVSNPPVAGGAADALTEVRVPKLDSVVFNAGFGGWTGIDWWKMAKCCVREGILNSCTWPDYKVAKPGDVIFQKNLSGKIIPGDSLGTVFCSNVFGHYVFAHKLMPLLSVPNHPGRIIWTSSIEPQADSLITADLQGIASAAPYESSKRLTDIMSLTHTIPSVAPAAASFYNDVPAETRPSIYVTHPGVVASPLFPLAAWMFQFYKWTMILCRILGSPWHPVEAYAGSAAAVWLILAGAAELTDKQAERVKWGSAVSSNGTTYIKETEVEGWGWKGIDGEEAEEENVDIGLLKRNVGRHPHAKDATAESRQEVIQTGKKVWEDMEKLRKDWEDLLEL